MVPTGRFFWLCVLLPLLDFATCRANHTDALNNAHPVRCSIQPTDVTFSRFIDDPWVVLSEFYFKLSNYSVNPLYEDISENYRPWRWYRTRSQHGRTLLMLSFNYNVLSMSILNIGVDTHDVELADTPAGCFGNLSAEERVNLIREMILDSFEQHEKSESQLKYESYIERTVYVCNEVVKNRDGYADFVNRCCNRDGDGSAKCTDQVVDLWVGILYVCITFVKVFVFFMLPYVIPKKLYNASYVASGYVVSLAKALKMKLFITRSTETPVQYKKRLTPNEIADWIKFMEKLESFPLDEVVPVKVEELRIKVKGDRVIPDNDPPTGVFRTLYDNIIRCRIRKLDPFTTCCQRSIYAEFGNPLDRTCTWRVCMQTFMRVLLLFLAPLPYYVRIIIYYKFEYDQIKQRETVAKTLQLRAGYDFYRSNIVQYISPVHWIFLSMYSFYFIAGCAMVIGGEHKRIKLINIVRNSLQDMDNVSRINALQLMTRIHLVPFKRFGLLGFIIYPFYIIFAGPVCTLIFLLYCVPTVYLSYRLMFHARNHLHFKMDFPGKSENSNKKGRIMNMKKKFMNIDRSMHGYSSLYSRTEIFSPLGYAKWNTIKRVFTQCAVGLFCLAYLYTLLILFVEAIGLIVEVLAFTMMGVIINAGAVLRYVSMALLVLVYMHDSYSNVYESYLKFNKTVCEDVMDRVDDLKKIASLPSSMQENAAFQVKPVETVDEIPTTMRFNKKEPTWRIGHLLLFLDSFDTPRIPLRLFQLISEVRVHGAPGPVYINLLKATGKFLIIVVFLFFVMIVVMAFGNAHQISSTNQTLATLAGGFVPMLLKNVLPRRSVKLNLKTLSFKGQIDDIICEFSQNWPLCDFICEQDTGEDDDDSVSKTEEKGDDDTEKESKKNGQDEADEKKDEGCEKGKNAEKEKSIEKKLELYMKDKEKGKREKEKKTSSENLNDLAPDTVSKSTSEDEDAVDLLIDLSEIENINLCDLYGSNDSITMISGLEGARKLHRMSVPHIKIHFN